MSILLQVQGVTKHFGGLLALSHVTFDLPEGQILGLIGPNGAGKTTLFNTINGVYKPDEGRIFFRGQDVTGKKPYQLAKMGLARTHQVVRPLNELTVRENVMAGACFGHENLSLGRAASIVGEVLEFVGLAARSINWQAASTSRKRSGWKWLGRWRRVPICSCSMKCWRASIPPKLTAWCRPS